MLLIFCIVFLILGNVCFLFVLKDYNKLSQKADTWRKSVDGIGTHNPK